MWESFISTYRGLFLLFTALTIILPLFQFSLQQALAEPLSPFFGLQDIRVQPHNWIDVYNEKLLYQIKWNKVFFINQQYKIVYSIELPIIHKISFILNGRLYYLGHTSLDYYGEVEEVIYYLKPDFYPSDLPKLTQEQNEKIDNWQKVSKSNIQKDLAFLFTTALL